MYDSYSYQIYQWLINTFYPKWQTEIGSIIDSLSNILKILEYGLYLGVFVFLYWVFFTLVRPHFFKC